METKVKKKWVKALRSGKYAQGRHVLKTEDGRYCCLGVLCVVLGDEIPENEGYLSVERRDELGLGGRYSATESEQAHLARMNDTGDSFDKIADYIEKHL